MCEPQGIVHRDSLVKGQTTGLLLLPLWTLEGPSMLKVRENVHAMFLFLLEVQMLRLYA